MILLDETPLQAFKGDGPADNSIRELVDGAWRDDVALEMWIDVTSRPVAIRLTGVLDESTGANLVNVVADCIAQGQRDFRLDTRKLRIAGAGGQVMNRIRERIHSADGRMYWDHDALV